MDSKKHTVRFVREKETKNTVRFSEVPPDGKPPLIGTLYLQKRVAGSANGVVVELTLEQKVMETPSKSVPKIESGLEFDSLKLKGKRGDIDGRY